MGKGFYSTDNKASVALSLLALAFISDLAFIFFDLNELRFFSKTLLMPLLLAWYFFITTKNIIIKQNFFILGLIFSLLGDFFLLFDWGFIPGLGSFLVAHVFYILCLYKVKKQSAFQVLPAVGLYLFLLLYFLFPYLGAMKVPVIIYGFVITTMLYFSFTTGNRLLIFGALLFVISDSVLAYSLFVESNLWLNLIVMITYVAAQFHLAKGFIKASVDN